MKAAYFEGIRKCLELGEPDLTLNLDYTLPSTVLYNDELSTPIIGTAQNSYRLYESISYNNLDQYSFSVPTVGTVYLRYKESGIDKTVYAGPFLGSRNTIAFTDDLSNKEPTEISNPPLCINGVSKYDVIPAITLDGVKGFIIPKFNTLMRCANGGYVLTDSASYIGEEFNYGGIVGSTTITEFVGNFHCLFTFPYINFDVIEIPAYNKITISPAIMYREPEASFIGNIIRVEESDYTVDVDWEGDIPDIDSLTISGVFNAEPDTNISIGYPGTLFQIGPVTENSPTSYTYVPYISALGYTGQRLTLRIGAEPENNPNPYNPGGLSTSAGGNGSYGSGEQSDNISGDVPQGSVEADYSGAGMFTHYLINSSYLEIIGDWLWTDNLGLTIAKEFISAIYGSPSESLISLTSYPFQITAPSEMREFYWGGHGAGFNAPVLTSPSMTVDWGTIELSEYWGNFLDYAPHTKIDLYLPWGTGFVSLDPGQVLPGTIKVITNIELAKGSCVHNVIGNNNVVIGSFSGQVAKQLPMTAQDTAGKVTGMVTAAVAPLAAGAVGMAGAASAAAGTAKATKGIPEFTRLPSGGYSQFSRAAEIGSTFAETAASNAGPLSRAAGKIATTSLAINKAPIHISRNGGFTDGSSSLSVQYPYIILSRPTQSMPEQYGSHYGYPSNIFASFRYLTGYTEVGEVHLTGIPASAEELSELDELLKGGVIF